MIHIAGRARQSFVLHCPLEAAWQWFNTPVEYFSLLPHIRVVKSYSPRRFRLLYEATELGLYRVRLFCDLAVQADARRRLLGIRPFSSPDGPVPPRSGLRTITSQGVFRSTTAFRADGGNTIIEYDLAIEARFRKPAILAPVPDSVAGEMAAPVVSWHVQEITAEFIRRVRHRVARVAASA